MEFKTNQISQTHQQSTEIDVIVHQFQTTDFNCEIIPHFPQEIIVEILLRLPVKCLLKFRCVSKLWRSLISSANFIKTHLENSTKNMSYTHHRILLSDKYSLPDEHKDCSLHSLLYNPVTNAIDVDYPTQSPSNSVFVVGSCNGLVCILLTSIDLFLWNPTTRKSKKLPDLVMEEDFNYFACELGFDEARDDYEVVGMFHSFEFYAPGTSKITVMVYSLKNDSWKNIGDFAGEEISLGGPGTGSGMFVNRKVYWRSKSNIFSLDIETGTCGIVEYPNYGGRVRYLFIGVLRGCLFVNIYYETHWDLWILNESGIKRSWTKVITIPSNDFEEEMPLYMLNNGEILLLFESNPVVYNPKDKNLRYPTIRNFVGCSQGNIYVESLVSPSDYGSGEQYQ